MNAQIADNQLVKLKEYQKTNRLKTEELAEKLKITTSLLYKLYKKERSLQEDIYDRIELLISNDSVFSLNDIEERKGKYVVKSKNTYQADTVEVLEMTGVNGKSLGVSTQSSVEDILLHLEKMGDMRNAGLLEEEEFLKIKNRLINLL